MKKIYIAGPDVFELDSIEIGRKLSQLCLSYGYIGLYPLDNVIDFNQEKNKIADDIYVANVELINSCDIVIANINPFRGKEADSGTIWECGYAKALGKEVYAYMSNNDSYLNQFNDDEKTFIDGLFLDDKSRVIEDFNYPINLMIASSAKIIKGSFEDVLKIL